MQRVYIQTLTMLLTLGSLSQSIAQESLNPTSIQPTFTNELIAQPINLQPKLLVQKPTIAKFEDGLFKNRIVVKFKDGATIRITKPTQNITSSTLSSPNSGRSNIKPILKFDANKLTNKDKNLLRRYNLSNTKVSADLQKVNTLLQRPSIEKWDKLFSRTNTELNNDRITVEKTIKQEFSDLSNYYSIKLKSEDNTLELLNQLNALDTVETAYLAPIPEDADLPPTTSSYISRQGYLNAAPSGVDARYAWTQSGGRGNDIRIIDIERGWNLDHEDLRGRFFKNGIIKGGSSRQHGTAVLGVMIAKADSAGVTGIVPNAKYGVVSAVRERSFLFVKWEDYSVAEAINVAASKLRKGDVIIIEQHAKGPGNSAGCGCNCAQYRYIAMEYWQAEYDAIRAATAKGIVVVEAAGNGGQNLDHSRYGNRFKRSTRDSGAILVGGGSSSSRSPMCWTNYGSRVDVQGWGENVMTTGYGDFKANGNDDKQWYSRSFSGTSSASPIVAGSVAAIQGIYKKRGYSPLSPKRMRSLLRSTGTAQATSSKQIGPLPNLREAIKKIPKEDCVSFNHNRVQAKRVNNRWKVVDGNHWIMDFANKRSEAIRARNIIKHYDLTKMCFIGRPDPSMTYFKANNEAPRGAYRGEDCISFNRSNLQVKRQNNRWIITDGRSSMLSFDNNRNEANAALATLRRLGVTRQCYVGRPDPSMRYFRK